MQHIESQQEYDRIVHELTAEFEDTIEQGLIGDVTHGLVASVARNVGPDGEFAVVHGAEALGEPVEAVDEALDPFDVLIYSHADGSDDPKLTELNDTPTTLAMDCLGNDIVAAYRDDL